MIALPYSTVRTARLAHRLVDVGSGPAVVLLHGFPEGPHSWRHVIPPLADAGYRVIAPSQRGYAGTDAPPEVTAYDQIELAADVVALLDTLGAADAVVVDHDWGGPVAWITALLHPQRVRGVVALSVGHGGRSPHPPISSLERRVGESFFYMLYFQEPGVAEAELEADVRESLRVFYYSASGDLPPGSFFVPQPRTAKLFDSMKAPPGLPPWLAEADLDVYAAAFRESGFRGPLNWYRNMDRSWERTAHLATAKVQQPALFIAGDRDPVVFFSQSVLQRMPEAVPRLRSQIMLPGCGHWTAQERPAEVTAELLAFLRGL